MPNSPSLSSSLDLGADSAARPIDELVYDFSTETVTAASAGPATFVVDHRSGITTWSPELKRYFGYPAEHRVEWEEFWHCLHPQDRAAVVMAIAGSLDPRGRGGFALTHRIVGHDGAPRVIHVEARTSFDSSAENALPVQTVGIVVDVTSAFTAEPVGVGSDAVQPEEVAR